MLVSIIEKNIRDKQLQIRKGLFGFTVLRFGLWFLGSVKTECLGEGMCKAAIDYIIAGQQELTREGKGLEYQ